MGVLEQNGEVFILPADSGRPADYFEFQSAGILESSGDQSAAAGKKWKSVG
jgi:hypothetical protein